MQRGSYPTRREYHGVTVDRAHPRFDDNEARDASKQPYKLLKTLNINVMNAGNVMITGKTKVVFCRLSPL
jgi:hypothetical protein